MLASSLAPWIVALYVLAFPGAARSAMQATTSAPPASAQPSGTAQNTPQIKRRVNLKNVLFSVTNKKRQLVTGLTKGDFEVFENNHPQTITFFSRETDLPLRIGVLIDTSNSIRERLPFEKQAAIDFLSAALRPSGDEAFVVGFDVEPELLQDYTDDVGKLSAAIRELRAGGGTGLFDAIYYACKQKMIYVPEPEPYLRRVLVIVSDGRDNESQHSLAEAISMAQRAEAIIFAISTNRSGIPTRGDKVLKTLAAETGGRAYFPFEASDLAASFDAITKELRSQYSLAYTPSDTAHDGTFRHIRIKPLVKGVQVHAPAGYFAPAS